MELAEGLRRLWDRLGSVTPATFRQLLELALPNQPIVLESVGQLIQQYPPDASGQIQLDEQAIGLISLTDQPRLLEILQHGEAELAPLLRLIASLQAQDQTIAPGQLAALVLTESNWRSAVQTIHRIGVSFEIHKLYCQQLLTKQRLTGEVLEIGLSLLSQPMLSIYLEELPRQRFDLVLPHFLAMQRGLFALGQGNFKEARTHLEELVSADHDSVAAILASAVAELADRQTPLAMATLARGCRRYPDQLPLVEAHAHLSRVTAGTGETSVGPGNWQPIPLLAGMEVDGWHLERPLGSGGWGQVFLARKSRQEAAIKVLHPQLTQDLLFAERFRREMSVLCSLRHPNIVEFTSFGQDPNTNCYYVTMRRVEGRPLEQVLMANGPLMPAEAVTMFSKLAEGLQHAHERGVLHRSIAPNNILLEYDGEPVLIDFGVASVFDSPTVALTGQTLYVPAFAAPEQLRGKQATPVSDIFSLAATMAYAMLYDRPEIREVQDFDSKVLENPTLAEVLQMALAQRVRDRIQRASGFAAALRRLAARAAPVSTSSGTMGTALVAEPSASEPIAKTMVQATSTADLPLLEAPFDADLARQTQQRWAQHLSRPAELSDSLSTQLVLIPPGQFLMGSDRSADEIARIFNSRAEWFTDEHPAHLVRLTQPFYLAIYEVTVAQFEAFVAETNYRTDAEKSPQGGRGFNPRTREFEWGTQYSWRNPGFPQTPNHPVVNVSWNDAQAFCQWLSRREGIGYRLPTEAEWEYACRAGTTTFYQGGDDPACLQQLGNIADAEAQAVLRGKQVPAGVGQSNFTGGTVSSDGYVFTAPVGKFQPNAFGLYDMHGNVWEWCDDWYDASYYRDSPTEDPRGPAKGEYKVLRGGSWFHFPVYVRSSDRDWNLPGDRLNIIGFRLVRNL